MTLNPGTDWLIGRAQSGPAGDNSMGSVISFPERTRRSRRGKRKGEAPASATVIILPVIHIERFTDEPSSRSQRRRRRRRASRP